MERQRCYGLLDDICVDPGASLAGRDDAQCYRLNFKLTKLQDALCHGVSLSFLSTAMG